MGWTLDVFWLAFSVHVHADHGAVGFLQRSRRFANDYSVITGFRLRTAIANPVFNQFTMPANQGSELHRLGDRTDCSQVCDMAVGALQDLGEILNRKKLEI